MIAYEFIKVKKFQPKTLVMYQAKRSPTNFCYREFFERHMAQVQLDLINQRNKLREQCEEENKSMFTALMQLSTRKKIAYDKNIPVGSVTLNR
jgi:hypothetical protein